MPKMLPRVRNVVKVMKLYILSAIRYRTLKDALKAYKKYSKRKGFTKGTMIYKFVHAYRVVGGKAKREV